MLPLKIDCIFIDTGNLISYKELKKKATQSPSEEVSDSVLSTINSHLSTLEDVVNDSNTVMCVNKAHIKVDKDDRMNLKVTVKVFLENLSCEDLKSSIFKAMEELGITFIDSLILSLPPLPSEEKLIDKIKPLWIELENLIADSKVASIGVSDLDTSELTELFNWSQVKPSINQVNLESCCVMPPEMTAFAQENDIQLLTHNDPKVLMTKEMLDKVLESVVPTPESWKMNWILRYTVVVKCRGIIQNKGFLLCAVKDI